MSAEDHDDDECKPEQIAADVYQQRRDGQLRTLRDRVQLGEIAKPLSSWDTPATKLLMEHFNDWIGILCESLDDACEKLGFDLGEGVWGGIGHLPGLAAHTEPLSAPPIALIYAESDFFLFCQLLSKGMALSTPLTFDGAPPGKVGMSRSADEVLAKIEGDSRLVEYWEQFARLFATTNSKEWSNYYSLDEQQRSVYWQHLLALELFALGHEYGHIICREKHSPHGTASAGGADPASQMEEELKADMYGVVLSRFAGGHMDPQSFDAMAGVGATTLFSALHLIERAHKALNPGATPIPASGSHPAIERRIAMVRSVKVLIAPQDVEYFDRACEEMARMFSLLGDTIVSRIETSR